MPSKVKAQSNALICVILAAGKGTRMRSRQPKVMHGIAGKPMLMHVIDTARGLSPQKIVVVTSPGMESVRAMLKKRYGEQVENAVQQQQLGTGDAVRAALTSLKNFTGTMLVLYGDTPLLQLGTLTQVVDALKDDAGLCVIGMEVPGPSDYGRLVTNKTGDLERIVEARDASEKELAITLCNSGVMAFKAELLTALLPKLTNKNAKGEFYLTDMVASARGEHHRCVIVRSSEAEMLGVNSRAELAQAEAHLQKRLRKQAMENGVTMIAPETVFLCTDTQFGEDVVIQPHVFFGPNVKIGNNVEIRAYCHIEGAKIRDEAIIGPFARLRPGAVIGEAAHIGNFVEVKQATFERGAKANHLSYIGDAHVGEAANIGAGTITCNYDGYHKHRTAIGAGAFIGSNTALVAPVAVGEGAIVGAGSVITEDVEADSLAIARAPQKHKSQWAKAFKNRKKN